MPTMNGDWPAVPVTAWEGVLGSCFSGSPEWRRSSRCSEGACIEVVALEDSILLRASDASDGSILAFTHAAWQDLTARIKQMTQPDA